MSLQHLSRTRRSDFTSSEALVLLALSIRGHARAASTPATDSAALPAAAEPSCANIVDL
jgi:hypothetical protein